MANITFNVAKGAAVAYYDRVVNNDPANSALVLIPIETTDLEADSVLIDMDTVAAVLAGGTDEQTTMGRKVLTNADLAAIPAPDDANDRNERSLPPVTWVAPTGNPISKILVAFDPDTTGGDDTTLIPLTMFDMALTPDGIDFELDASTFFRAS